MWRDIAIVGLGFGAIWLGVTFAVPIAFATGAVTFWGKSDTQGLAWLMAAGSVISAFMLIPSYFQTVDRCQQLQQYQSPTVVEQITGKQTVTAEDLEYIQDDCAHLPLT